MYYSVFQKNERQTQAIFIVLIYMNLISFNSIIITAVAIMCINNLRPSAESIEYIGIHLMSLLIY